MKKRILNETLILILAAGGAIFFVGCASTETGNTANTKSLLSAAGFRVRTPQTADQKEIYEALPNNKIEHAIVKGKVFYVFKDEKAGVAYVGGEPAHRRYQQLCLQQHVAQAPEENMSYNLAFGWMDNPGGAQAVQWVRSINRRSRFGRFEMVFQRPPVLSQTGLDSFPANCL